MADEQAKIEAAPDTKPARPGRAGRLVLVLQLLDTVAIVAVLALQLLRPGGARQAPRAAEERHAAATATSTKGDGGDAPGHDAAPPGGLPGPTMRLADFVVHLRDPDADRYARVSFEVELRDEKAKEGLAARLPQLRDAFLVYLSDRSSDDLRGGDAISRVKAALNQKLGDVAKDVPVRGLYITELVVQ